MTKRYAKRPADDGHWRVVYVSTGQVVTLDGNPMDDLEEREAEESMRLLEEGELVPDVSEGP